MQPDEIQELMDINGWNRTKLAAELGMTESSVHQWMNGSRKPLSPAAILMRMWLAEAKARKAKPRQGKRKAVAR